MNLSPEDWHADFDQLYEFIITTHPHPYYKVKKTEWEDLRLNFKHGNITPLAAMFQLVAFLGDAHSYIFPSSISGKKVPLVFDIFHDGMFIVKSENPNEEGARVLSINNISIEDLWLNADKYLAYDNEASRIWMFTGFIIYSFFLELIGVETTKLTIQSDRGVIKPELVDLETDLTFIIDHDAGGAKAFELQTITEDYAHVLINKINGDEDTTFRQYTDILFEELKSKQPDKLIFDLRQNGGGNNYNNQYLIHSLIPSVWNKIGKLYVITGKNTFSAACNLASDSERETWALFAGSPMGAPSNHYGDPVKETLDKSGIRFRISAVYWQKNDFRDKRPWIVPDIPIHYSYSDQENDPTIGKILEFKLPKEFENAEEIYTPNVKWHRSSQNEAYRYRYSS